MSEELLNCPFCGTKPFYTKFNSGIALIACQNIKCILNAAGIPIEQWNRRHPPSSIHQRYNNGKLIPILI